MAEVILDHIKKSYKNNLVIKDLNMHIKDGEFVTLVGPSGCGKSTTLRMIAGLEEISEGNLYIGDKLANNIPPKNRKIGMVFQSYALFPHLTVAANITFGLKIRKFSKEEKAKRLEWAINLLDLKGLENRYPRELSGGQRQRVALGRALVLNPEVLLLDEPLSNLDAKLRLKMRTEFKRLHKKTKYTVVYVTHDQVEAMTLSDRIAILHNGILQQVGTPEEVYNNPANMFVAGFIGSPPINFIEVEIKNENGNIFLVNKGLKIKLPEKKGNILKKYHDIKKIILGIRPQSIYLKKYGEIEIKNDKIKNLEDNIIKTRIDVIEPLGSEVIVVVRVGDYTLKATLPEKINFKVDAPIELGINTNEIHLFDINTQKALV